jgi:hypothetical protein
MKLGKKDDAKSAAFAGLLQEGLDIDKVRLVV